jgi:hypothetical protein
VKRFGITKPALPKVQLPQLRKPPPKTLGDQISVYAAQIEKELRDEVPDKIKAGRLVRVKFVGVYSDGTEELLASEDVDMPMQSGLSYHFENITLNIS